jgi:hypothetical protein
MAKKKSAKKVKHEHFKLSAHDHPQEKVLVYIVVSLVLGVTLGWFFGNQFITVLASTP